MAKDGNDKEGKTIEIGSPTKGPMIDAGPELLTPDNVTMIVSMVSTAIGITTAAIKGIQLWVNERTSRKIKVRYKEMEIEISGVVSERELEEKINIFRNYYENFEKEQIEIIVDD